MDFKKAANIIHLVENLLQTGEEWFGYETDEVEWTNPKYHHQN